MKPTTLIPVSPAELREIRPSDWCRLRVLADHEFALVVSGPERMRDQVRVYLPDSGSMVWLPGSTRVLRAHLESIHVELDGAEDEYTALDAVGGAA